jgi:hypothetical protein
MKCKLTKEGMLIVESETDVEEYALERWKEKNDEYGRFDTFIKLKRDDK